MARAGGASRARPRTPPAWARAGPSASSPPRRARPPPPPSAGAPGRRAEDRSVVGAVGPVDVVTARAVAPLPRLVAWCRGLLRPGTQLVALVGSRAVDELPGMLPELAAAGMRDVHPRAVGAALGEAAT